MRKRKRKALWGAACLSCETHDSLVDATLAVDASLADETVPESKTGCSQQPLPHLSASRY